MKVNKPIGNHEHRVEQKAPATRILIAVLTLFTQLLVVARAQGHQDITPQKPPAIAHKLTLNVTHLIGSGFELSAFVETGSTSDVCLATFNTSNRSEALAPILCSSIEYHGKRGLRLLSYLPAHPPDDFVAGVTVYQQDAQYYGPPIRCEIR